jgi:hypothetical protein
MSLSMVGSSYALRSWEVGENAPGQRSITYGMLDGTVILGNNFLAFFSCNEKNTFALWQVASGPQQPDPP